MPAGRPTDYREEYAEQARKLCLLGATDAELGDFFEVSEQTINSWKKEHPAFLESIRDGKEKADADVAEALYNRALGYEWTDEYVRKDGEVGSITRQVPPDTKAASLWLRNRQPKKWRDTKQLEHSTPEGGKVVVVSGIEAPPPGSESEYEG
jgi:hypothetical protein